MGVRGRRLLVARILGRRRHGARRDHGSRREVVDPDAVAAELDGHRPRQRHYARLRRAVRPVVRGPGPAAHRRQARDAARDSLSPHVVGDGLDDEELVLQVAAEDGVPFRLAVVEQVVPLRRAHHAADDVGQAVDFAERLFRLRDNLVGAGLCLDVGHDAVGLDAEVAHLRHRLLHARAVDVHGDDVGARLRQGLRRRRADAAAARAADDRVLAVEPDPFHYHAVPPLLSARIMPLL